MLSGRTLSTLKSKQIEIVSTLKIFPHRADRALSLNILAISWLYRKVKEEILRRMGLWEGRVCGRGRPGRDPGPGPSQPGGGAALHQSGLHNQQQLIHLPCLFCCGCHYRPSSRAVRASDHLPALTTFEVGEAGPSQSKNHRAGEFGATRIPYSASEM